MATIAQNKSAIDRHSEKIKAIEEQNGEMSKEIKEINKKLSPAYFEQIDTMYHQFSGNGKPGFVSIRDKVTSWESKFNAVMVAVLVDIGLQIYRTIKP